MAVKKVKKEIDKDEEYEMTTYLTHAVPKVVKETEPTVGVDPRFGDWVNPGDEGSGHLSITFPNSEVADDHCTTHPSDTERCDVNQ